MSTLAVRAPSRVVVVTAALAALAFCGSLGLGPDGFGLPVDPTAARLVFS